MLKSPVQMVGRFSRFFVWFDSCDTLSLVVLLGELYIQIILMVTPAFVASCTLVV